MSMQQTVFLGQQGWMTPTTTWTNLFSFGCSTLYVLLPCVLRTSTLNWFYVFYMILALAFLSPWHTPAEHAYSFSFILVLFMRLPFLLLCSRISLVLVMNLAFVVVMALRASTERLGKYGSFNVVVWTELTSCDLPRSF